MIFSDEKRFYLDGQMVINTIGMTSEKKKMFFMQETWRRFCNGLGRNFSIWED